ncbi:MAG: (d)CMP kinase [Saprospiraceae bacterium]|nr:(d)CMP kinase [Saprospiraceae bacterium]MBK8669685.1 (d)CMP kinase [Saprospiraceae bacterium]
MSKPVIIALDGYSSCGKSTLAKQIARHLHFLFVDSGAMYRAATLYFIENNIDVAKDNEVNNALENIHITFKNIDGENTTFLNGRNVESEIRSLQVSGLVSEVSAISSVRKKMVELQRQMSSENGIVMDGRDIGTVVFPNADIKFFVTADPIVRAQRRYNELLSKNQKADLHEVISNLEHRDKIDTERADSPLRQADDAILLDNTHYDIDEQFSIVMDKIYKAIKGLS